MTSGSPLRTPRFFCKRPFRSELGLFSRLVQKHGRWIKILRQQLDELHMLDPFLTPVFASRTPSLRRLILAHAPPLPVPSCDGATGVGGAIPATSISCLAANIRVCNAAHCPEQTQSPPATEPRPTGTASPAPAPPRCRPMDYPPTAWAWSV